MRETLSRADLLVLLVDLDIALVLLPLEEKLPVPDGLEVKLPVPDGLLEEKLPVVDGRRLYMVRRGIEKKLTKQHESRLVDVLTNIKGMIKESDGDEEK